MIEISQKSVCKGPINNIPALVQIMAWRRPGNKPLSEPMVISLLTLNQFCYCYYPQGCTLTKHHFTVKKNYHESLLYIAVFPVLWCVARHIAGHTMEWTVTIRALPHWNCLVIICWEYRVHLQNGVYSACFLVFCCGLVLDGFTNIHPPPQKLGIFLDVWKSGELFSNHVILPSFCLVIQPAVDGWCWNSLTKINCYLHNISLFV